MRVVQNTIADGVSDGLIADICVPCLGRELARDDGRPEIVPSFEHLENVLALGYLQRRDRPVVDHQDIDPRKLLELLRVVAGGSCETEFVEKPRCTSIQNTISTTTAHL